MKIVDSSQMNQIDRRAGEEYGIPSLLLMENAGIRLWETFLSDLTQGQFPLPQGCGYGGGLRLPSLVFFAGTGNNGGDALVMARQAWNRGFRRITVVLARDPEELRRYGESSALHLSICRRLGIPLTVGGGNTTSWRRCWPRGM